MSRLSKTAETILERRYYLKDDEGKPKEDWERLCRRVAIAIAAPENPEDREFVSESFFKVIRSLDFLPNSPCLMNAGTDLGQLSACFVLPIEDSMSGIFDAIKFGALIHQSGGGTGYSFSRLRPKNAPVKSTQGVASGPVSFAQVFDAATETIKQGGKRRGANMGVLRVDHPDILEFIRAKSTEGVLKNFNLSVALTDDFMRAYYAADKFDLINPKDGSVVDRIDAIDLFNQIIKLAWKNGEPGILFIDEANRDNPVPQLGNCESTNPCGEQWLLPYESCNLGSINLGNFVDRSTRAVDWERLGSVVKIATRFLDNVIDCNKFPIPQIEEMTLTTRKIGLGIMGLHDYLIQLELPYASQEGRDAAAKVMSFIKEVALKESEFLAQIKGPFPAFDPTINLYTPRRNAALTSIQPTGTVSMVAECSSGCEPHFLIVTEKHVMDQDRLLISNRYFEQIGREEGFYSDELLEKIIETSTVIGHDEIPLKWQEIFRTAQEISTEDHIAMQGILQRNGVDSSISKTINMPNDATIESVRDAYLLGHQERCKGLTIYRDGSRSEQVLNKKGTETPVENNNIVEDHRLLVKEELPDVLPGTKYKLSDRDSHSMSITICFDECENPKEVFAEFEVCSDTDYKDKATMWTTTCRLVSSALRFGMPLTEIIDQLDKSTGHMLDLPAQLSKLFKSFLSQTKQGYQAICPECKESNLVFEEGCTKCYNCGFSKCQ